MPNAEYDVDTARAAKLEFLLKGDIRTRAQAAVIFALMHQNVSTVLVGFSDTTQIDEAASCSGLGPLPSSAMKRLGELWSNDFVSGNSKL